MTRLRNAVLAAACLLALPAMAGDPSAKCTVLVVHGLPQGQGIDPKINRLRPYLEKAPFTAWKQFKLLEEKTLTLQPKGAETFVLPNGKQATLTYLEHAPSSEGKKHRLRLQLAISEGGKQLLNTVFVLDEGGVVLQAGQKHQNGLLILGFGCQGAD